VLQDTDAAGNVSADTASIVVLLSLWSFFNPIFTWLTLKVHRDMPLAVFQFPCQLTAQLLESLFLGAGGGVEDMVLTVPAETSGPLFHADSFQHCSNRVKI